MIPTTADMKSQSLWTSPTFHLAPLGLDSMMSSLKRIHLGLKFAGKVQALSCTWLLVLFGSSGYLKIPKHARPLVIGASLAQIITLSIPDPWISDFLQTDLMWNLCPLRMITEAATCIWNSPNKYLLGTTSVLGAVLVPVAIDRTGVSFCERSDGLYYNIKGSWYCGKCGLGRKDSVISVLCWLLLLV